MRTDARDANDLGRFVAAQQGVHDPVLRELRSGRKTGHWMWFVFPQLAGLGRSETSRFYAIASLDEARAYLADPVLGPYLRECAAAVLAVDGRTAEEIFGGIDALKLRSSMTLFHRAAPEEALFRSVLERFFAGRPDPATDRLLADAAGSAELATRGTIPAQSTIAGGPMAGPATVDEYLATLPEDRRAAMEQLRSAIRAAAPDAQEQLSYKMPAFKTHGQFLVSYDSYKKHYSLFPASEAVVDRLGDEIQPHLAGRGTIQFPANRPLPLDLVRRIVQIRVAENAAEAERRASPKG